MTASGSESAFSMRDLEEAVEKIRRLPRTPLDDFIGGRAFVRSGDGPGQEGIAALAREGLLRSEENAAIPVGVAGVMFGKAGAMAIVGDDGAVTRLPDPPPLFPSNIDHELPAYKARIFTFAPRVALAPSPVLMLSERARRPAVERESDWRPRWLARLVARPDDHTFRVRICGLFWLDGRTWRAWQAARWGGAA